MMIARKQVAVSGDHGIGFGLGRGGGIFLLERGDFLHLDKVRGEGVDRTQFSCHRWVVGKRLFEFRRVSVIGG